MLKKILRGREVCLFAQEVFYFVYIGSWEKFLPAFLGYAEVMREQQDEEKTGDFMELVQK